MSDSERDGEGGLIMVYWLGEGGTGVGKRGDWGSFGWLLGFSSNYSITGLFSKSFEISQKKTAVLYGIIAYMYTRF